MWIFVSVINKVTIAIDLKICKVPSLQQLTHWSFWPSESSTHNLHWWWAWIRRSSKRFLSSMNDIHNSKHRDIKKLSIQKRSKNDNVHPENQHLHHLPHPLTTLIQRKTLPNHHCAHSPVPLQHLPLSILPTSSTMSVPNSTHFNTPFGMGLRKCVIGWCFQGKSSSLSSCWEKCWENAFST